MKIIKVKSKWNVNYQSTSSFENKIYFQNKLTVIPIENLIQNKEHFSLLIKEHNTCNDIQLVFKSVEFIIFSQIGYDFLGKIACNSKKEFTVGDLTWLFL